LTRLDGIVQLLHRGGIKSILIGGIAAAAHGSPRVTQDVEVVYDRSVENLRRIAETLAAAHPYLRGAPPGLPFRLDVATLNSGLNFTLTTDLGPLDLLGEVAGGGRYEDLSAHCVEAEVFGVQCKVLDLDTLIATKKAAGRPKDYEAVAELELLRDRR
jgi:hypothetical protein